MRTFGGVVTAIAVAVLFMGTAASTSHAQTASAAVPKKHYYLTRAFDGVWSVSIFTQAGTSEARPARQAIAEAAARWDLMVGRPRRETQGRNGARSCQTAGRSARRRDQPFRDTAARPGGVNARAQWAKIARNGDRMVRDRLNIGDEGTGRPGPHAVLILVS